MSNFYVVEILNPNGDVQARHTFPTLPIRLGRAYSNDVILDDPHTAAEHALIELNDQGQLSLRDLGSKNGLKINGKKYSRGELTGDTQVQLGRTLIRVRRSDYAHAEEILYRAHSHKQTLFRFAGAIAIICLLALSNAWLGDIANNSLSDYITSTLKWLCAAAAWAGIWALANRIFNRSANFGQHLLILSGALLAFDCLGYLYVFLGFSLSLEQVVRYQTPTQLTLLAITFYAHLRLINHRHRLLKILCAAFALLSSGVLLMNNYQKTNQYADRLYMSELLPPALRLSRNHSLAEFDQSIQQLKADIDAERAQALKQKAEKNNPKKP